MGLAHHHASNARGMGVEAALNIALSVDAQHHAGAGAFGKIGHHLIRNTNHVMRHVGKHAVDERRIAVQQLHYQGDVKAVSVKNSVSVKVFRKSMRPCFCASDQFRPTPAAFIFGSMVALGCPPIL